VYPQQVAKKYFWIWLPIDQIAKWTGHGKDAIFIWRISHQCEIGQLFPKKWVTTAILITVFPKADDKLRNSIPGMMTLKLGGPLLAAAETPEEQANSKEKIIPRGPVLTL